MSKWYNGYSPKQRDAISAELKKLIRAGETKTIAYLLAEGPCDLCGDPGTQIKWHSEDYSTPYLFSPPATYRICNCCHGRIHKRFGEPEEWKLYVEHLKKGGYGREFVKLYSLPRRKVWRDQVLKGNSVEMPPVRPRKVGSSEWWTQLSLDSQSLVAAWARPRPLRAHPSEEDFRTALSKVRPSAEELSMLRVHAKSERSSATMRQIARIALNSNSSEYANLRYGRLAKRLAETLSWTPDVRNDKSPIWMSVIADGWQSADGEFEWVMVPSLASICRDV